MGQRLLLIGAVERHVPTFVIQATTDGTGGQPGSSPPRPLGVKPGRPLSCGQKKPREKRGEVVLLEKVGGRLKETGFVGLST